MSWNYRIIEKRNPEGEAYYALHEVHYGKSGEPEGRTTEPCDFGGMTPNDIISGLNMAIKDYRKHGILIDPWPDKE